jgi:acetyl/propionyl-CoA carboxylase alpha subunit
MPLTKCLIANRGEIALRIIRACRELNIHSVAVYSSADAQAQHVQLADSAYLPSESYLNIPKLLEVAHTAGCDCVHAGYGFLSENADFAQAVIDSGLTWIGPLPETIRLMGIKTAARQRMEQAGVPLVPGFQSDTADDAAFITAAQKIGYPVMVKAAGGGGGKGIRQQI